MSYTEYQEIKTPEEILQKLEDAAERGEPITLGQAGLMGWLTKQSQEGWNVVWQYGIGQFPFILFSREVEED